jgi:branched-chain amino acid transport system substrate-binding protein
MEKTSDMTAWRRSLVAAAAALALAACTGGPSTEQSGTSARVRIGLLAPLSGPRSDMGRDALRGAQLAADLVNQPSTVPLPLAAGAGLPGLGGARLQIDSADTRGDPERAATQAVRLATQPVAGLVSIGDTQSTALASERTERVGVPFVDGGAPANYLSERGMDWYFRIGPNDRMLGARLLSLLQQTESGSARKLAIVHSGDSAGTDMSVALEGLAGEGGYQVVTDVALPAPGASAKALVDQVRAGAPDAVIAATSQAADSSTLLSGFQEAGWRPPVTMAMGAGFASQQPLLGTAAAVLHSGAWSAVVAERNPVARQVADLYKRRFGGQMSEASAKAFTATLTLAQAVDAAGSTAAGRVRAALLALQIPGRDTIMPWDGIRFDEAGQNTQAAAVVERLTQDGVQVVFPPELAAGA